MTSDPTLHPNLARIRAAQMRLLARHAAGELSAAEVRTRIAALVARDDCGVQWRMDPSTGMWQREQADGSWELGVPPTFGVATLTASDVSDASTRADVDDTSVVAFALEDAELPQDQLFGGARRSILRQREQIVDGGQGAASANWRVGAGVAAVALLLAVVIRIF